MAIIQWFPGHMAKAKRQVAEQLHLVDIIFELVDARLPESSRNPALNEILGDKPRLLILNKADLADAVQIKAWLKYYEKNGQPAIAVNAQQGLRINQIEKKSQQILAEKIQRRADKGMKPRAIRAVCVGIPNVGKSTLLNRLVKRNIAKTGNKPGVTKGQQWLKLGTALELLDTPGILWPKFEDQQVGLKLALTGAIKDNLLHQDEVALFALDFFKKYYPQNLSSFYKLKEADLELSDSDLLLLLTQKMGYRDDYDRASEKVIFDIRKGKLGAFILDRVPEVEDV